jgi:NitT/TauT family transport system substrate-binding protein
MRLRTLTAIRSRTRVCTAAFAFALAALAPAAHAAPLEHVTYVLDWFPSGEETFPYVAIRQGLFAREGLDVTIQIGRGSSDAITKIATGTAQFGSGGIGALMTAAAEHKDSGGIPVRAILSIFNTPPDAIFAIKGGPVTSIKSLKGLKLATATFTSSNTMWPVVAHAAGLDPASVTLLKTDPTTLAPLLASGQVDAIINWVTSTPGIQSVVSQAHKDLEILPWTDAGLTGYGLSLFASDKVIHDQPDLVARFTRAFSAAVQRSIADCHAAAADLHALVPDAEADTAEAECKTTVALIHNATSVHDGFGTFEPGLLKQTWDWTAQAQGYKADLIDPETLVDRSFVPHS